MILESGTGAWSPRSGREADGPVDRPDDSAVDGQLDDRVNHDRRAKRGADGKHDELPDHAEADDDEGDNDAEPDPFQHAVAPLVPFREGVGKSEEAKGEEGEAD